MLCMLYIRVVYHLHQIKVLTVSHLNMLSLLALIILVQMCHSLSTEVTNLSHNSGFFFN